MNKMEDIFLSKNINKSIIEMDNHICKLCLWGKNLEKLNEHQKIFYYNQELEREINYGGFSQYFYNSSGRYAYETIAALKIIGANKTADLLNEAIAQFPNNIVPVNGEERKKILEHSLPYISEVLERLTQNFFLYQDDLNVLNMEYIRQNISAFI